MNALDVEARSVLFVGDDLRNDMEGAHALGCITAWMPPVQLPAEPPRPGVVDHSLTGLADLSGLPILN